MEKTSPVFFKASLKQMRNANSCNFLIIIQQFWNLMSWYYSETQLVFGYLRSWLQILLKFWAWNVGTDNLTNTSNVFFSRTGTWFATHSLPCLTLLTMKGYLSWTGPAVCGKFALVSNFYFIIMRCSWWSLLNQARDKPSGLVPLFQAYQHNDFNCPITHTHTPTFSQ